VAVEATPYVMNHVDHMMDMSGIKPGDRVLDIGCGMGKFTIPISERGIDIDAFDLSPRFLEELQAQAQGRTNIRTFCGDALAPDASLYETYDHVIGFFMLHHLIDIPRAFAQVRRLLKPGGRIAFIEPNPLCPLYYLQVTFAPNMSWEAEKGILDLHRKQVLKGLEDAGFARSRIELYGILPPFLRNRRRGARAERLFERLTPLKPVSAFQVILAET
jgi:2-polyprenyl-3-methyl-5-hydroxy-6-metoxy-1,4-benzoquinol methylase